jgi:hypothetical protein
LPLLLRDRLKDAPIGLGGVSKLPNIGELAVPDPYAQGNVLIERDFHRTWWRKSLFLAGESKACEAFLEKDVPAPQAFPYGLDGKLLAWIHPRLGPGLHFIPLKMGGDEDEGSASLFADKEGDAEFEEWERRIRSVLPGSGLNEVEPDDARHLIAAVVGDPEPGLEEVLYRSIDLVYQFDAIPSPIPIGPVSHFRPSLGNLS